MQNLIKKGVGGGTQTAFQTTSPAVLMLHPKVTLIVAASFQTDGTQCL